MRLFYLLFLIFLLGCGSKESNRTSLDAHHLKTYEEGERILQIGKKMALVDKEIIRGGCWSYIDTIYNRAGYPLKKRKYIFYGKKGKPPYAPLHLIKPGDWLYYINHSYKKSEHSGIFVRWHNRLKKQAVILSYGGENRKKPGRYRIYDISNTYVILRASK